MLLNANKFVFNIIYFILNILKPYILTYTYYLIGIAKYKTYNKLKGARYKYYINRNYRFYTLVYLFI
jgi:hypothetical protein